MHFKNTSSAETPQSGGSTMPNQRDPPWHCRTITLRGRVLFDFTEQRDMVVLSSDSLIFMAAKDRQAVLDIPSSKTLHFKYAKMWSTITPDGILNVQNPSCPKKPTIAASRGTWNGPKAFPDNLLEQTLSNK
jgi:hypothetical protein